MKDSTFLPTIFNWLSSNTAQAVQLLSALTPVLALIVVAYAIRAIIVTNGRGKK